MRKAKLKTTPAAAPKQAAAQPDTSFQLPAGVGLAGVAILGLVIYSNSFTAGFQLDDLNNIVNNPAIRDLSDVKTWWNFVPARRIGYFTFALNYHFHQLDVRYWHYVNVGIHLLNAMLVWWLARLIFASPALEGGPAARHRNTVALLMALMFVAHPLATQSVTYIVQRLASLTALFYLLAVALYLKARLTESGAKYGLFAGAFIAAALAMQTKENAFTLPGALLLCELCLLRKNTAPTRLPAPRLLTGAAVAFVLLMAALFTTASLNVFAPIPPSQGNAQTVTSLNYLLTNFSVLVKYIQLLFLPLSQNLDYDFPVSNHFFEARTLLSFLLLTALFALAVFQFNKNRVLTFGIFWFFLTLSIESTIVPINDYIFEHRTYLPSFGFFLILCTLLVHYLWSTQKGLALLLFATIIGSNAYLTYQRNKVWKTSITLWSDAAAKSPGKARPFHNRGQAYAQLGRWDKAIEDYTQAIKNDPRYAPVYSNRAQAYDRLGQWNKAIADYDKALEIDADPNIYTNRGAAYANIGQWEKAVADYTKALEKKPGLAVTYSNRGLAYANLGRWDDAVTDLGKAIELNPADPAAYMNRGFTYGKMNQPDKALADYTTIIRQDPKYQQAYYSRGLIYGKLGRPEQAIQDFSKAIELKPDAAIVYYNRGVAYDNTGQLEKALADYNHALSLAPALTNAQRARDAAALRLREQKR